MKKIFMLIIFVLCVSALAQEATPEATPEATAEFTPEATAAVAPEATAESTEELAQCPILVEQALEVTKNSCSNTSLNEACYGYILVDADLRSSEARFVTQGDRTDVANIQSLQLSPMDTQTGQWGVMIMEVEASTPDGEMVSQDDVQIVLFGDTEVSAAVQFVEVTATTQVNIRRQPRTNAEVLGQLEEGQSILANARLEDDSWLRVRLSGEDTPVGWISRDFLDVATDISVLPSFTTAEAEELPTDIGATYGPMQAFIYESGDATSSPCEEAPNGLMIQTPEGAASVTLWLDEVVIELDGTGIVTAQADGTMTVGVIEGSAQVAANGDSRTVVAGQATDIQLDANLAPVSAPSDPRALTTAETNGLPIVLLNNSVTIPTTVDTNTPIAGQWSFTLTTPAPYICSDGSEIQQQSTGQPAIITPQLDALNFSGLLYAQVATGVYRATYDDGNGNVVQDTLQVIGSDRIVGERTIDLINPVCTLSLTFSLQLIEPN